MQISLILSSRTGAFKAENSKFHASPRVSVAHPVGIDSSRAKSLTNKYKNNSVIICADFVIINELSDECTAYELNSEFSKKSTDRTIKELAITVIYYIVNELKVILTHEGL